MIWYGPVPSSTHETEPPTTTLTGSGEKLEPSSVTVICALAGGSQQTSRPVAATSRQRARRLSDLSEREQTACVIGFIAVARTTAKRALPASNTSDTFCRPLLKFTG